MTPMAWEPTYASATDLKGYKGIRDAHDDTEVALAVEAASRAVDRATFRQFGQVDTAEARYYTARWYPSLCAWMVECDDIASTSGLAVALDLDDDGTWSTALTSGDWRLHPLNAAAKSKPWEALEIRHDASAQPSGRPHEVEVTAVFGWAAVPDNVKQATLLQASRFLSRRNSPYGVAGSPEQGNELRLLAQVDPDVRVMLAGRRRRWAAA